VGEAGFLPSGTTLLLNNLLGDLEHARVRLRQVERADVRKLPHLLMGAQRRQQNFVVTRF
jgi:predicted AAA+ superfamily ATPase